jgi:hypothetical protein
MRVSRTKLLVCLVFFAVEWYDDGDGDDGDDERGTWM